MKRKLLPLLAIAFVVAVISTGIFYGLIMGKVRSISGGRSPHTILVAARGIERGTVLEKTHVKLAPSESKAPQGAFTDPEQVAGLTVLKPIEENQPVTPENLSARSSAGGFARAIPAGMRAVSIRVADSPGVISMLQPGHKVDVQAVRNRNTQNGTDAELRTILQNVEVVAVQPEGQGRLAGTAVVTVLAKPGESDVLGVADAGARIRLVLRNPVDEEKASFSSLILAALFQPSGPETAPRVVCAAATAKDPAPPSKRSTFTPRVDTQVQLHVRIAEAAPAALQELDSRLLAPRHSDALQVSAFRPGWNLEHALQGFQARRLLEILSASNLLTGNNREVSMLAGAHWTSSREPAVADRAGVRIQFLPVVSARGKLRLRVQPEITSSQGSGVATRRIETEVDLSDGQSFLVTGLLEPRGGPSLIARLFPGRSSEGANGELVILATPQLLHSTQLDRRTSAALKKP